MIVFSYSNALLVHVQLRGASICTAICLFPYFLADQFDIVLLPQDRIEIVEANIADRPDVVISANVIIMNNVFEFFLEPEEQISVWRFLRQTIKPGTLLVTMPPLEDTFSHLQVSIGV